MNVLQIANELGVSTRTVQRKAKALFADRVRRGSTTEFNENEVEQIKNLFKKKEVSTEKLMTTREIARQLNVDPQTFIRSAQRYLPNKDIKHGKTVYWTLEEATVVLEEMKAHPSNHQAGSVGKNDTTPALKAGVLSRLDKSHPSNHQAGSVGKNDNTSALKAEVVSNSKKAHPSNHEAGSVGRNLQDVSTELSQKYRLKKSASEFAQHINDVAYDEFITFINDVTNTFLKKLHKDNEVLTIENSQLRKENDVLKHSLEYNKVSGWVRWSDIKKELKISRPFKMVKEEQGLVEHEDYELKCMGYDTFPTTLIEPRTAERLRREYVGNTL